MGWNEHGHDLGFHVHVVHRCTYPHCTGHKPLLTLIQWVASFAGSKGAFNPYLIFLFYSL